MIVNLNWVTQSVDHLVSRHLRIRAQSKLLIVAVMKDGLTAAASGGTVDKTSNSTNDGKVCIPNIKKKCRFSDTEVIEFEVDVSSCTVPSNGVPIGLSSVIRKRSRQPLDVYENERENPRSPNKRPKRIDRQKFMILGHLQPNDRVEMLGRAPHIEIKTIEQMAVECSEIRTQRQDSLRTRSAAPAQPPPRPKPCDLFSFLNHINDTPSSVGIADLY